ncbi:hypothetical protein FQN49_002734 [Arthroderma sp. PD_2]|nr:hypothetical protein FQN49_002734 [Arthroderma sp. PD_2]
MSSQTMAQDNKNEPEPGNNPPDDPKNPPPPAPAPPPPGNTDNTPAPNPAPAPTETNPNEDDEPDNTDNAPSPTPPPPATTDDKPPATVDLPTLGTTTTESEESTQTQSSPTTSVSIPDVTNDGPSISLPSLTGIGQIPTAIIPPKKGAPYLQHSNLPEGTVFIGVGAGLGVIFLAIFAWRALVAWSINRSVRRAATTPHQSDAAATTLLNPSKRKSKAYRQSMGASMSLEKLNSGNTSNNRHSALHRVSQPPNSSLFFSPTAGASNMHTAGNRGSGYLPAGYYAASGASPGAGAGMQHSTSSIGLSPLGPQAQGYSRTRSTGPTPPDSPALSPTMRRYEQTHPSTSSLNLTSPPQGRAPSAYLEDLFENHPSGPQR